MVKVSSLPLGFVIALFLTAVGCQPSTEVADRAVTDSSAEIESSNGSPAPGLSAPLMMDESSDSHQNVAVDIVNEARLEVDSVEVAVDAIQPHMAVGHDGTVYLTFIHHGNISVSISRDQGGSFSDPVIAMDIQGRARGGAHRGPRIGVDGNNHLTITAPVTFDDTEYEKKYPTADLFLVRSTDGGSNWSEPARVNEVPKTAPEALHWMSVAPDGKAHIAWLDTRDREGPGQDIYFATAVDGNVGTNVQVASTVCECCAPGLALDGSGNPLLAWREGGEKPSREIFARWSNNGGREFGEARQINSEATREESCPMSAPAVAVSGDGLRFAAAWKDISRGKPKVHWVVSESPEFQPAELVQDDTDAQQDHPSLCIDGSGTAWVAWEDRQSGVQSLRVRSSREGDTVRSIIAPDQAAALFPTLAAGPDFVAVVFETRSQDNRSIRFQLVSSMRQAAE